MNFPIRDRRTILFIVAGLMLAAVLYRYGVFAGGSDSTPSVVAAGAAVDSIPMAEKRLEILRRKAATVPGREQVLAGVKAELASREKGIVVADTAEEARAHLMETLHSTAAMNGFDARGANMLPQPKPLGKDYGQVSVGEDFTCGIDQLVNFLAAIATQPEAMATESIYIGARGDKNKTVQVKLTLSGVVPRRLVPEKKGPSSN
jgi:hypothetical protein